MISLFLVAIALTYYWWTKHPGEMRTCQRDNRLRWLCWSGVRSPENFLGEETETLQPSFELRGQVLGGWVRTHATLLCSCCSPGIDLDKIRLWNLCLNKRLLQVGLEVVVKDVFRKRSYKENNMSLWFISNDTRLRSKNSVSCCARTRQGVASSISGRSRGDRV